ncbi:MAG: SRPBCC family protein [Gaiellaceae bacterium]
MIRATWSVRIERPAEEVFDYIADVDHEPEWNPRVSNVVRTSPGPIGLGAVWEGDNRRIGHQVATIEVYERPRLLSFESRSPRAELRIRFELEPDGDGATLVTCAGELTTKGPLRLLEPLLARTTRRRSRHERPAALKAVLER